jgi:TRAP-type C4-dicarboxylate transport system permease small subunit
MKLRRVLERLYAAAAGVAAVFVAAIFLLMIAQALFRRAGVQIGGVTDLVGWLTAGAAFLAMAHTFRQADFVRVGLVLERLPVRARRLVELAALTTAAVFVGYLAWWAAAYTYESWQLHDMPTGQLAVPLWIPQSTFALGALLFLVAVLDDLVVSLRGGRASYLRAADQRRQRGDTGEGV